MMQLEQQPERVRACFRDPRVKYAALRVFDGRINSAPGL